MIMGQYLLSFVLTTLAVVAFLYLVYLYIKQNPQLSSSLKAKKGNKQGLPLWVESSMTLEPRKQLYVIRHGQQRFLIATTVDKTEFLATLETAPQADPETEEETVQSDAPTGTPLSPDAGFMERFGYSLKMVLGERFTRSGGQ